MIYVLLPMVYNPGSPDADKNGYVHMPNVNMTDEIMDLMNARRIYEANATVFQVARAMLHKAIDTGMQHVTKIAAMGKCFATDTAMEVATDAVQIFGGYGFMEDYPIAKCFRDAKILQIYEGTNQVQRMVIARNLIKEASELEHLAAYIPKEAQRSYKAGTPDKTGS